jgi:cell division protein FtsZ
LSLYEVNEAATMIQEEAHEDANIIFGAVIDEKMKDEIRVTVIATGFGEKVEQPRSKPALQSLATAAAARNKKVVHLGTIVDDLDTPTWQRKRQGAQEPETVTLDKAIQFSADDDDKYDIPTFLRKQMD